MDKNEEKKLNAEELQEALLKCEKEREEYLNGWKRAKADFINYKKEEADRFKQFAAISNEALISELITVLDSLGLGLAVLENDKPAQKGMLLIKNQLEEVLKKYGLEKIIVKPGDVFDPLKHEALGEVESEQPAGTIGEVVEGGYILNGKIIRPARVNLSLKGQKQTNNN